MAYIITTSAGFGKTADTVLAGGGKEAVQSAKKGTLAGAFKAQGIMTETVITVGSIAATNSSFNQGAQQGGNK